MVSSHVDEFGLGPVVDHEGPHDSGRLDNNVEFIFFKNFRQFEKCRFPASKIIELFGKVIQIVSIKDLDKAFFYFYTWYLNIMIFKFLKYWIYKI